MSKRFKSFGRPGSYVRMVEDNTQQSLFMWTPYLYREHAMFIAEEADSEIRGLKIELAGAHARSEDFRRELDKRAEQIRTLRYELAALTDKYEKLRPPLGPLSNP